MTAVAHGLLTGDRFRVRAGAGGAVPTGLAQATDYFAIRVDADNIKPAASSADALANTPINLTAAGSSSFVEHGLPFCIPTALASPMTQMKSANDNSAWAALVAIYCFLVGLAQTVFTGIKLAANQNIELQGTGVVKHGDRIRSIHATSIVGQSAAITYTTEAAILGSSASHGLPLNFVAGERLKSISFLVLGNGTTDLDVQLWRVNADGTGTQIGSTHTVTNPGASYALSTFNVTDTDVDVDKSYSLLLQTNGGGIRVATILATYDRP